ncbi:MAG: hypothetical protein ACFFD3_02765 [Candidatus Thorarchaeota archaeon]
MKTQAIFDWSRVHRYDHKVLLLSIPLFILYAALLNVICIIEEVLIVGMLYLIVQLAVGMTATRICHRLGNRAKAALALIDPSTLNSSWQLTKTAIHQGEIGRIFEKFYKSIQEADKKTADDINDIAWFLVAVWTMVSTLAVMTVDAFRPFCLISAGVLALICFLTYYEGHRGLTNGYFEDEIDHLEFHVISRMSLLSSITPDARTNVIWKERNSKMVLYDFSVAFEFNEKIKLSLEYFLGLPSSDYERFVINGSENEIKRIEASLGSLLSDFPGWEPIKTSNASMILMNTEHQTELGNRDSLIRSPEKPVYLEKIAMLVMSTVINGRH